jgi:hypothetical protein
MVFVMAMATSPVVGFMAMFILFMQKWSEQMYSLSVVF